METVLTIDDCSVTTGLIRQSLGADGYRTISAHTSQDALEIVGSQQVDLALVGLQVPEIRASGLIAELKRVAPALPIVALSGESDVSTVVSVMKLGVQDCIAKPIDFDRLRSVAKAALATGCAPLILEPQIGGYRVKHSLGEGQVGIVFEVERGGQSYAMKILRVPRDRAQAEMRRMRFDREGALLRELDHPNIVQVYDSGVCANSGQPYMVMELVQGNTLSHLMETSAKALCIEAKMELFRGLLEGLVYLEEHDILHRDIKPANIMLDHSQRPILVDFGLVRLMDSSLTDTMAFLGTPAYMAPEAILDNRLTFRSDQFSLAAVAYEFLFESRPFRAETVPKLCTEIVYSRPAPPEIQVPEVWLPVFDILRVAMAKKPDLRYPSARQFLADWDACLEGAVPMYARERLPGVLCSSSDRNRPVTKEYSVCDTRIAARPTLGLDTEAETWCSIGGIGEALAALS